MTTPVFKRPLVFIPPLMSAAALALILAHAAIYGIVHEADEGAAAHVFHILIAGQLPLMLWLAIKWFGREPGRTARILALQVAATIPAWASVYFLT